jgi:hypothetical protein
MARLPRCLRASQALHEDPLRRQPAQTADFWSVNGVTRHSVYHPPTPHERVQVSIGGDVHRDRYRDETTRPLTLGEQIADLVNRSKT